MDEDHEEVRFVCKLCDKRFQSGKSLGGHMRSHVIVTPTTAASSAADSSESDDKFDKLDDKFDKFEPMKQHPALIINGNSNSNPNSNPNSYGLRDNPKRSWRASSSSTLPAPNERICKQCGKGFQSLKALCGHMAFHSEKDKSLKDCDDSWTSENLDHEDKLSEDSSHSDTEENEQQDPISVTRSRSKRYKKLVIKPPSFSLTNINSNNSNYHYGSSSVSEIDGFEQEDVAMWLMMLSKDSTNWAGVNSVALETKFSSTNIDKSRKEWNLDNKLESRKMDCGNAVKDFNYKELSYEEKQEIRRNLFREFGYDEFLKKIIQEEDGSYKKRNKYECMNCNKTFSSFQGLGGHRPCHRRNNGLNSSADGSEVEFPRDQTAKFEKKARPKKNKGHECPICFRMFKSGQALGGHKRSHFINGSENRIDHMMEHAVTAYTDMIDLNLPAPEED